MSTAAVPAIEIVGLRKVFGDTVAVDGLDLTMDAGTVLAVLGPNGAGKTTTIDVCSTLLQPDAGTVRVAGHDVVSDADEVRQRISLTGQFAAVDAELTGEENLVLFGRLLGLGRAAAQTRSTELLERFDLVDAGAKRVKTYSGGMRRRLDLAVSLVRRPEVLFLDEPSTGLDPRSRNDLWAIVAGLRDEGTSVLLTTQYLEEADHLADRIVVIDHGRVIASGTSAELKQRVGAAAEPKMVPQEPSLDDVFLALTGSPATDRPVDA